MLSVIRPLHQDVATKLFKSAIKTLARDSSKIEPLGLAVRALGEISCSVEFLNVLKDFQVLATLREKIESPLSAHTMAYIFTVASSSNACDWIDSSTKSEIAHQLIGHLHMAPCQARLSLVRCLSHLCDQIENFGSMLNAESIKPNIQTYREKLKFLSILSCPSEISDEFLVEANLRYLLSSLSVNFSLLWDPTIKIIESYWADVEQEKCWNIFYSIFHDVNERAAKEESEVCQKVGIDFPNYRNLLLKSLNSMVQIAEKKNSILAVEFLDVFMQGKQDTKDAKGLAAFLGVYKQVSF